jgi:hypothetical protein
LSFSTNSVINNVNNLSKNNANIHT